MKCELARFAATAGSAFLATAIVDAIESAVPNSTAVNIDFRIFSLPAILLHRLRREWRRNVCAGKLGCQSFYVEAVTHVVLEYWREQRIVVRRKNPKAAVRPE